MTDAKLDNNYNPVLIVASNADGVTPMMIYVDPSSHGLMIEDGTTGTDFPRATAPRDRNQNPTAMGVSSSDGTTPIPIYGNPATGALLIKTT